MFFEPLPAGERARPGAMSGPDWWDLTFEFAAERPAGGIGLSVVQFDGAAIAAAAARSAPYWPESQH